LKNAKTKNTRVFFVFFEGLWWLEKITKKQKKHKANTKPKNQKTKLWRYFF
jgi:hypothetical protein